MKKLTARSLSFAAAAAIAGTAFLPNASAITLTYDSDSSAPANDGAGVWDTTTLNWYNGATDVVWPNSIGDTAIFGVGGTLANAAAGTVTVGTVNVGTIQFNPTVTTGYTLATGNITLGTGITTTNILQSTISAKISGTNGLAFTGVSGSGVGATLSGANDYTGITTISTGGRLNSGNATAFGSSAGGSATALGTNYTQVNTGATAGVTASTAEPFLINGTGSSTAGAIRLNNVQTLSGFIQLGSAALITGNFGSGTISGNVDLNGNVLTVGNGGNAITLTVSGQVTGGGGITVSTGTGSANALNLTNISNTYSGVTTVSAGSTPGTLGLGGDTVLGSSSLVLNGGTVQSTNATARTITNVIGTVNGNATFGATTIQTGTLNFSNTGATSLGTTARTFTTNVDTTFAAAFSNTAALTKAGAATLILTGSSINTGAINVTAGTLLANNTTGSGTGAGTVSVTGATLGGSGVIGGIAGATGAVTINAAGIVAPGDPATLAGIGQLTIGSSAVNRNMVFGAGSAFNIQVGSGTSSDLLTVFGNLDLSTNSDTLNVSGTLSGANYLIATYTGSLTGTFDTFTGLSGAYTVDYSTPGSVFLAVPEPGSYAMLLGGLGLMFGWRSFRRRTAN